MTSADRVILSFPCPCAPNSSASRMLRRQVRSALRASELPIIIDLSHCSTLNREDVDLLLDCVAQGAGRDTQILLVAASNATQVLLEVTRISSLIPIFNSVEEALAYTKTVAPNRVEPNSRTTTGTTECVHESDGI